MKQQYKEITMEVTVRVPVEMYIRQARAEVRSRINEMRPEYDLKTDDIKAVRCTTSRDADLIKRIAESTKLLRDLRQYCSHIRSQVMDHHRILRNTKITYIDLDRLDGISIACHLNVDAMKKRGVSPQALKHFMNSGQSKES